MCGIVHLDRREHEADPDAHDEQCGRSDIGVDEHGEPARERALECAHQPGKMPADGDHGDGCADADENRKVRNHAGDNADSTNVERHQPGDLGPPVTVIRQVEHSNGEVPAPDENGVGDSTEHEQMNHEPARCRDLAMHE